MYPTISQLEAKIEEIWTKNIKEDLLQRRFIYYEKSLVASFYHHLRPFVDQFSGIRMFVGYRIGKDSEYDLVIMKNPFSSTWEEQELWSWIGEHLWFVMEFKFCPKTGEEAQKDILKLQLLKKYNSNIKRAYFFSIDKNTDCTRFLRMRGKWYQNYYREGRGILDEAQDGGWNFYIDKY